MSIPFHFCHELINNNSITQDTKAGAKKYFIFKKHHERRYHSSVESCLKAIRESVCWWKQTISGIARAKHCLLYNVALVHVRARRHRRDDWICPLLARPLNKASSLSFSPSSFLSLVCGLALVRVTPLLAASWDYARACTHI